MRKRYYSFSIAAALAAAALCCAWRAAKAQNVKSPTYDVRPTCKCGASCLIRPGTYGYNETSWRQWPTQYRPEVSDPRAVGARRIPAPPGAAEQKLPEAPNVPSPPAGGSILPGGPAPSGSGATTVPPGGPASGIPPSLAPGPEGTLIFPGDLGTPQKMPELKPGGEGGGPLPPSGKAPAPSDGNKPSAAPSPPATKQAPAQEPAAKQPATTSGPEKSDSGQPLLVPPKAEAPSAPGDVTPGKPASPSAALRPERDAVAASFQQLEPRTADARSSRLPSPLEGFCPVELRENEKWVAGRAEYQATYNGQVYRFSSAAARRRFLAAPQDYAPVQGGNDIVAALEGNALVPGSIQNSAVWKGRLYLFGSAANLAAFRENPGRYLNREPAAPQPSSRSQPVTRKLQMPSDSL